MGFILSFLLILNTLIQFPDDDPFVEKGKMLIAKHDSTNLYFFHRSLKEWKEQVQFFRYIGSPFKHTRFYLYFSAYRSPPPLNILCSFNDTISFLPPYCSKCNDFQGVDSSTFAFLNNRLKYENDFDSVEVTDLALFLNKLLDDGLDTRVVLSSWKDIEYSNKDIITDSLKSLIKPLSVSHDDNGYQVTFFAWLKYDRNLYLMNLNYKNKSFVLHSRFLSKYGKLWVRP